MFQLYSKRCEYTLRALAYAASRDAGERIRVPDVCENIGIPESYTRKAFQELAHAGFLEVQRGPGGGYALSRPAEEISVMDVIEAVDGKGAFDQCVLGFKECNADRPCPLHHVWTAGKNKLIEELRNTSIREVSRVTATVPSGHEIPVEEPKQADAKRSRARKKEAR